MGSLAFPPTQTLATGGQLWHRSKKHMGGSGGNDSIEAAAVFGRSV